MHYGLVDKSLGCRAIIQFLTSTVPAKKPWWVIWLKISIEWGIKSGISHLDIELYYVVENQLFLTCFVQSQNKAKFDFLISKMQGTLKHHWPNRFNETI